MEKYLKCKKCSYTCYTKVGMSYHLNQEHTPVEAVTPDMLSAFCTEHDVTNGKEVR